MSDTINCPVKFHQGVNKFGVFANAFRIMQEAGQECFLDFCVYSSQEERAEVVARVRIHRTFVPVIRERLADAMLEIPSEGEGYIVENGLVKTPDGNIVLLQPLGEVFD